MNKFRSYFSVAALALAVSLTGCSVSGTAASAGQAGTTSASDSQALTAASVDEDTHFDADDLTWDAAEEVAVTLADGASTRGGRLVVGRCKGRRRHCHHQCGRHLPPLRQPVRRPGGGRRRRGGRGAHHPGRGRPQQFHRVPVRRPERQRGHHLPRGRHHQRPSGCRQLRGPGRGLPQRRALFHGRPHHRRRRFLDGQRPVQRRHRLQGRPRAGRRQRDRGRVGRRHPGQGLHGPAGRRLHRHRRRGRGEGGQRDRRGPRLAPGQRRRR